jgi:hypothetical protein
MSISKSSARERMRLTCEESGHHDEPSEATPTDPRTADS